MTYVLGFAVCGAASVVAGVTLTLGMGAGFIAAGGFLLLGSYIITKGLPSDG